MSEEDKEDKDTSKQGVNFLHQDEKAPDGDRENKELLQEAPQL